MTQNNELSDTQIKFLNELIELVIENWRIDEQEYDFYKYHIEEWQKQGYYDDAMLYFWYYEPVEGLNSKQVDNFNAFIKVINGLGFILPSTKQASIIGTLRHIESFRTCLTVKDRTEAILDYWQAIDYVGVIDVGELYKKFNLMRDKHLIIQEDNWEDLDETLFNNAYQDILDTCNQWEDSCSKTKNEIYKSVIYNGESLETQAKNTNSQYEADMLETLRFDEISIQHKNSTRSTLKKLLEWIRGL